MQEMYASGMTDVPTPQIPTEEEEKAGVTNELREGNYWQRAIEELMKSPETLAWEEETKALDMMASQTEEVIVPADTVKKLLESARDLEAAEGKARDARRKEKETRKQAEEKIRELQSESEALREEAKKKPALRIRILQNFKEGIQYFRAGDVIETPNIEWALAKIEQGLAERVGIEVPVKIVPEAPPRVEVKLEVPKDRVRYLTDRFFEYLRQNDVPVTDIYRRAWRVRLEDVILQAREETQLPLTEEFAQTLVDEYKRKVAERVRRRLEVPPEERLPPGWKMVEGGYLVNGRFVPWEEWEAGRVRVEEEWVGPHVIRLEEWVGDALHMSMAQFDQLPIEKVKEYVVRYKEYIRRQYGVE